MARALLSGVPLQLRSAEPSTAREKAAASSMALSAPVALLAAACASALLGMGPTSTAHAQMQNVGGDPDGKPPPAFMAARLKQPDELNALLAEAGDDEAKRLAMVNVEWGGKHPIDIAVMNGNPEVVQALVDAGAQLQNPGSSAQPGNFVRTRAHSPAVQHALTDSAPGRLRRWSAATAPRLLARPPICCGAAAQRR